MWNRFGVISLGMVVVICLLCIAMHIRDTRLRLMGGPVQTEQQIEEAQERFRNVWRSNP